MKSGNGSARNGDKAERKNLPRKDGSRSVGELRERRKLQSGAREQNAGASRKTTPSFTNVLR